ncbi:hypothetical protein CBL_05969 [Carabus blaptoides fortunei]
MAIPQALIKPDSLLTIWFCLTGLVEATRQWINCAVDSTCTKARAVFEVVQWNQEAALVTRPRAARGEGYGSTRARVYLWTPEMRVHPMIAPPGARRASELERASRVLVLFPIASTFAAAAAVSVRQQ